MTLRLEIVRCLPRGVVRRAVLDRLTRATTEALGVAAPDWGGLPAQERLAAYAEYTASEGARVSGGAAGAGPCVGPAGVVDERLRQNAAILGTQVRRLLGIRRPQDALRTLEFLYAQIGIDISGQAGVGDQAGGRGNGASHGDQACFPHDPAAGLSGERLTEIEIRRCFFADYYRAPVCRLMSALDAGVVDGLFGGASLEFTQRLTEGGGCCRAIIRTAGART